MMTIAILLVLLINLVFTSILIAGVYYLTILPLDKRLESRLRVVANRPQIQSPLLQTSGPEGILPDMDDIPLEALYGEEEEQDYRTRPEDVEEALTERSHNTYNSPRISSLSQLKALNQDVS
jgi:hypothetical protein